MLLFLRSIQVMLRSLFKPTLRSIDEETTEQFRVCPLDIDWFFHMNHGRHLNYMEACRWGIVIRTRFLWTCLRNGWTFPIRKSHVDYFRPLKPFQKFRVQSRIVHTQEKWIFIIQRFFSGDQEVARGGIQATVRKGRENIPSSVYLKTMGIDGYAPPQPALEKELHQWLTSNGFEIDAESKE